MSAPVVQDSHLKRNELSGTGVDTILSQLGEWLCKADFEVDGKIEKCADKKLDQHCRPLFIESDLLKKVRGSLILGDIKLIIYRFILTRPELSTM